MTAKILSQIVALVAASAPLIASGLAPLTGVGKWYVASVADSVLVFAVVQ